MSRIAIVKDKTDPAEVVSWINGETPMTWVPPKGTHLVREEDMAPGWIEPPEPMSPVPESVSPYQFRAWLITHGISMSQIDQSLASIEDTDRRALATLAWEYGLSVQRANVFVEEFGKALGLDDAAIDRAFIEAAEIK
jgi:hypothetical protein